MMRLHWKSRENASIRSSLTSSIILCVLLPLFAALLVLCVMMQRSVSSGISEAYEMMFEQNIREVDSAILRANYVSSTMITYTENNRLLKAYYAAENDYERRAAVEQIREMILNCNVTMLDSFGGSLVILTNDGRLINSEKSTWIDNTVREQDWYQALMASGETPYWDAAMGELFDGDPAAGVVFGRVLTRYQEGGYGCALISMPKSLFTDNRYHNGALAMFDEHGRLLIGEDENYSAEQLSDLLARWQESGSGSYGEYYVMGSRLSTSRNTLLYVGARHVIYARSEQIFWYLMAFMVVIASILLAVIQYLSNYITMPILFYSERTRLIENGRPEDLTLTQNPFRETRELQRGMLQAQGRIQNLVEEVRTETAMKEKARFDALKAQINPHFIFNTLNAIRWKAIINEDQEVAVSLVDLGLLLRETYKNNDELETIGNAVYTLEAYARIMQVRFGDGIKFFIVIPGELEDYMIPRFCLQPLVENSFIHGMIHAQTGVIALRGEMKGPDIVLTLIDDGEGLHGKVIDLSVEEEPKKRGITGIGLSNIHRRIQMIYGEEYGLHIDTEVEMGFKITLRIPAVRQEEQADEGADRRG